MFPARAGMSRAGITTALIAVCVPRASGDEPALTRHRKLYLKCSPRERG